MSKTIFLVEQNANHALNLSQSALLLDKAEGRKAYLGLH